MKYRVFYFILLSSFFVELKAEESIKFTQQNWEVLEYSNIKPNQVSFKNGAMIISVDQSASPLIYPFKKPKAIKEIVIDADISGRLKLNKQQQGKKGNDDYTFRIGLVYQGDKKLGFMQRQLAPQWVKRLYSLAPKDLGISHIEFFSVYQDKRLANVRPANTSDLFKDNYFLEQPQNGKIRATIKIPPNKNILAIWINSDGDDTKSKFSVKINKLLLR